jgi:methyl coenzyme M reductase subunit D
MNTIRLDLALTRDEIAATIRQLSVKLNPSRLLKDHTGRALLIGLALVTLVGSIAVHGADRRARDRKYYGV